MDNSHNINIDEEKYNSYIEKENLYDSEGLDGGVITEPFNPKDVDIVPQTMVISNILDRLFHHEIILEPDFQRRRNLWDDQKQSRLIESLIIRIPLPTFYFDYDEDDHYIVVDGLQRLWTLQRFAVLDPSDSNRLHLKGLEYLTEYNGKTFEELPPSIQRRIKEQTIIAFVIRPGTPESVRNSIFTRINTGGLQLTPAEIKNSIYRGQAAKLLKELAHSKAFVQATGGKVSPERMLDCEFVNRFLAFYILGTDNYRNNLEDYLNKVLQKIKRASEKEIAEYRSTFLKTMDVCHQVFEDKAFKKLNKDGKYGRINKPLFECVTVCFSRLKSHEVDKLLGKKEEFLALYEKILSDIDFFDSISNGTARLVNINRRNCAMNKIIKEVLEDD